jgi:hypothetical protein
MPQISECRGDEARQRASPDLRRMTAVLPTSKTPRSTPVQIGGSGAKAGKIQPPADRLVPIGPERLRALREAIRNGTYPSDDHVLGGLERMFAGAKGRGE